MRHLRLLLLAAGLLLAAAKPLPDDGGDGAARDEGAQLYRGRAISICVADLRASVPALGPDDLEGICSCAIDRFVEERPAGSLPAIEPGRFRGLLESQLMACTAQVRPERMSDVARRSMGPPAVRPAPVPPPAPIDKPAPSDAQAPAAEDGGFWDWLPSLSWPTWLSGASLTLWIAIGIFVFGLLILRIRGRDPRKDLTGPPSSMRRGAPPQPPRRPDLPR
jgi:hypothetical protein